MSELRKTLRLLFSRELERVDGLLSRLRRWRRSCLGHRGSSPAPDSQRGRHHRAERGLRARRRVPVQADRAGIGLRTRRSLREGPGSGRRERRPHSAALRALGRALGATTFSVLFHAALLGILLLVGRGEPTGSPQPPGESTIMVYLVPPSEVRPRPEEDSRAPKETPEPPAAEEGRPTEGADHREEAPRGAAETPAEEPSGGDPEADARTFEKIAVQPLPLPLGMAGSPRESFGPAGELPSGLASRGTGKARALSRFGGSSQTEDAVERGLRWLARHQDRDGGWSAEGFQRHCGEHVPCAGQGLSEFDVGVSALATLAFLGAGHVPHGDSTSRRSRPASSSGTVLSGTAFARTSTSMSDDGAAGSDRYSRTVRASLEHLLSLQDAAGGFGVVGYNYMYNHALATFAMSEAYALTGSERYRQSTESALAFTYIAQQNEGGWDYTRKTTGRNDLSITGWQILAIRSAENAGIPVPASVLERIRRYLRIAVRPTGIGIYADKGQEKGRRGINMVAVGLLSKLYLGASRDEPAVRGAMALLLRTPPDPQALGSWDATFQSYYYWYTATLALFHCGGEEWTAWNLFLTRKLLPLQSRRPHEDGSWQPELSWIGISGGRVYSTAINVLTLETYYRYAPLYESRGR